MSCFIFEPPLRLGGRKDLILGGPALALTDQDGAGTFQFSQGDGRTSQVSIWNAQVLRLIGGRDKDSRQIARIKSHQYPRAQRKDSRKQRVPIPDAADLEAVLAHPPYFRWQKIHHKPRRIGNAGLRSAGHRLCPGLGGNGMQAAMNPQVVMPCNLHGYPAFQLGHRHRGFCLARVGAAIGRIGHRRARQSMDAAHQRSQIPLNMPAEMRTARWPIFQVDAIALATPAQGLAVKFRTVVAMQYAGKPMHGPIQLQSTLLEPGVFG